MFTAQNWSHALNIFKNQGEGERKLKDKNHKEDKRKGSVILNKILQLSSLKCPVAIHQAANDTKFLSKNVNITNIN